MPPTPRREMASFLHRALGRWRMRSIATPRMPNAEEETVLNIPFTSTAPPSADRGVGWRALAMPLAVMAIVLAAGCQAPAAAPSSAAETTPSAQLATPMASATDEPTASSVVGACLDEEVLDAVDEVRSGDLDTDMPIAEVADALDTLELEGRPDEVREQLTSALRANPTVDDDIVLAAVAFWAEVPVEEC